MAISVVSFSFSRAAHLEARGPSSLLDDGFLYCILSLTHLISNPIRGPKVPFCRVVAFPTTSCLQLLLSPTNWLPVLTELYNSSIAHSISLEWHVWSSSSGNNCHAVHRSLSSGASIYECTMGFYLVPYCQPSPPTRFPLITAIRMCHFLPLHHFGMACLAGSKVNIQHLHTSRMWHNVNFLSDVKQFWIQFSFS